jgi:hypothetical protein
VHQGNFSRLAAPKRFHGIYSRHNYRPWQHKEALSSDLQVNLPLQKHTNSDDPATEHLVFWWGVNLALPAPHLTYDALLLFACDIRPDVDIDITYFTTD